MYVIKAILVEGDIYKGSRFINCTCKTISSALNMLDNAVREHLREEVGREASVNANIIDVHSLDQVVEPVIDGMVCYRLSDDPHRINVYQRKTAVIKQNNWTWGQTDVATTTFKRAVIFELEDCEKDTFERLQDAKTTISYEMTSVGPAHIRLPKQMTIAPMCNVITELKKCEAFQARLAISERVEIMTHEMQQDVFSEEVDSEFDSSYTDSDSCEFSDDY